MSPIRASELGRYPADWRLISDRIRFARAAGRCECEGECGGAAHNGMIADTGIPRCLNVHMTPSVYSPSRVILTTAHLDHTPENTDDDNLRAMCQHCHLNYDREHHAETRRTALENARTTAGQVPLS